MFPRPRGFSLSVLVALDGSIRIPSHRSKIEAEGQDRHGTRGQADTHEGRSNQTSRNRHGIQSHLVSHHRRKSLLVRFLSTTIMIHEQAPNLYIQTPTPQTKHNTSRRRRHAKQQTIPADTSPPTPAVARTTGTGASTTRTSRRTPRQRLLRDGEDKRTNRGNDKT